MNRFVAIITLLIVFHPAGRQLRGQAPTVAAAVRVAGQDGPVQVVGLRRPEETAHYPLVHLRNASSRATKSIVIEAIIRNRDGRVHRVSSNDPNLLWPDERKIPAGAEGWVHEVVLQSSRLIFAAKSLRSNCVNVTVLVARVEFSDGSSWNRDEGQKGISWTYPAESPQEDPCKSSTAGGAELAQITGAELESPNPAKPNEDDELQNYSFSCSLLARNGKLVARCPR